MRTLATALAVSAVLLAAGCGSPDEPAPPGSTPSRPTTSAEAPAPEGERTLKGKVEAGVEAGCMILRAEGESYMLVGPEIETQDIEPGSEIEVTGRIGTDVASFCQQGTPFVVEDVRPG